MARSSTTFQVGNKGNPKGRPKSAGLVREAAREHTAEAIETLAKVMRCRVPQARVAAARELLDRGHGKAPAVATDLSQISDAELITEIRRRADLRATEAGGGEAGATAQTH